MPTIQPVVRYLILCEDVVTDPAQPQRISITGLISRIHSIDDPPFPLLYEELCVFLQLTGCRAPGHGRIEIHHADSGHVVFRGQDYLLQFPSDPLEIVGLTFRVRDCLFPEAGLHWVQFWYNDSLLAQQPLVLR